MSTYYQFSTGFFLVENISNLNYDFDLYKGFCMGQMTQFRQILKKKESKSPDLYIKFQ
jgi:hypothetical protein